MYERCVRQLICAEHVDYFWSQYLCVGNLAEATENLLTRCDSCLWSWRVSLGRRQRQLKSWLSGVIVAFGLGMFHWAYGRSNWKPAYRARWLPLVLAGFIESKAEATEILLTGRDSCLWSWSVSLGS